MLDLTLNKVDSRADPTVRREADYRMANLSTAMAYDILVRGGSVLDGTGSSPRTADIEIQGGRRGASS